MIRSNKKFFFLLGFVVLAFILLFLMTATPPSSSRSLMLGSYGPALRSWTDYSNQDYESECLALYKRLRFPNMSLFFNPPLREPPKNMYDEFTQNGKMPIKKWYYFNDVYSDSKGGQNNNKRVIKKQDIENLLKSVRSNLPLGYDDKVNKKS